MATKKITKKTAGTRQRASRSLPNKSVREKTTNATKKSRTGTKVSTTKRKALKKATRPAKTKVKQASTRQLRIPFGPHTSLIIQLTRDDKPERRTKQKTQAASRIKSFLQDQRKVFAIGLIALGLFGTAYFGTDVFRPRPALSVYSPPAPTTIAIPKPLAEAKVKTLPKSQPTGLHIAAIGLDVPLIEVARNPDNTLEVPKSADTPGWYRLSPTPGELGPSIIVGHVDSPRGPAVFWRLRELSAGQAVEVRRADGTAVRFKITKVRQFEQDNFPTAEVYGDIDHPGLRLITCGGSFNRITGEYSHNTVVFATLED